MKLLPQATTVLYKLNFFSNKTAELLIQVKVLRAQKMHIVYASKFSQVERTFQFWIDLAISVLFRIRDQACCSLVGWLEVIT